MEAVTEFVEVGAIAVSIKFLNGGAFWSDDCILVIERVKLGVVPATV